MKKLMIAIAAVATAFGLYADDAVLKNGTSFEFEEAGVSADGKTFTPADSSLWTSGVQTFDIINYTEAGETPYAYTKEARRDGEFPQENTNEGYLKLTDATNTLTRTASTGDVFVDQLVKFTSFDEVPVIEDGAKIAIWKAGFENDAGTVTNGSLCVAVGDGAGHVKHVRLANEVEDDTWYRITVRNDGLVQTETGTGHIGYAIFINGAQAQIVAGDRGYLGAVASTLTPAAKYLYDNGKLFASIPHELESFGIESVGYKGQGAIDDVIVSVDGPTFAAAEIEATITKVANATLTDVTVGEQSVQFTTGDNAYTFAITPGLQAVLTFAPAQGYRIAKTQITTDPITGTNPINVSAELAPALVIATVSNVAASLVEYAETELFGMIENLKNGDLVTFNAGGSVTNGEGTVLYKFTKNTTIDVQIADDATTWGIKVNEIEDKIDGTFTDNVGVAAGDTKTVTFATEDSLYVVGDVTVAGTLEAAAIDAKGDITLVGDGKVYSVDDKLEIIDDQGKSVTAKDASEEKGTGWFVYAIKPTFDITIDEPENGTLETSVTNGIAAGKTVTVIATPAANYHLVAITIGGTPLGKDVTTFTMPAEDVTVAATFEIDTFTVKFVQDLNLATTDTVENVAWNTRVPIDKVPALKPVTGYNVAWDKDPAATQITKDTTFTAEYTPVNYTITYWNGNTQLHDLAPSNYTVVAAATLPNEVTLLGASFQGWFVNSDCTGEAVTEIPAGSTGNTNFYAKVVQIVEQDPTVEKPDDIPESDTAGDRYGSKVPTALAGVSAKAIATWAQGNGDLEKGDEIIENAFLLNCENTEKAVNAAKANFKATSITVNSDGSVTVGTPEGYNGEIKKLGKAELSDDEWSENLTGKKFFQLKLVPANLN